jgi:hypothetical protein
VDRWREIGEQILRISHSSGWWLGDWLLYGERAYPERYRTAIEGTMLDYQTLRNYAWVARRFKSARRRERLSVQHHIEVASMSDEEQDAWLDRAERFSWSRNKLRAMVKTDREVARGVTPNTTPAQRAVDVQMNVSNERKQLWTEAAERAKLDLIEWMQIVLDHAANRVAEK